MYDCISFASISLMLPNARTRVKNPTECLSRILKKAEGPNTSIFKRALILLLFSKDLLALSKLLKLFAISVLNFTALVPIFTLAKNKVASHGRLLLII